jgi:hypothetical protein
MGLAGHLHRRPLRAAFICKQTRRRAVDRNKYSYIGDKYSPFAFALAHSVRATDIVALVAAQGDSLHSTASNTAETLYPAQNTMAIERQVDDEIRDAPEFVTSV